MPLLSDTDQYRKYGYQCMEMNIHFDDGTESFVESINPIKLIDFSITSDYIHDLFPIIHLRLSLERSLYYKILKYKNKAKLHLRIDKFYRNLGRSEKSLYRKFINDTFDFVLDDDDADLHETIKWEEKSMDYDNFNMDDSNDLRHAGNVVEFYVYKSSNVDAMDTVVNKVLTDVTVQDAFQYVLNKIGFRDYLMGQMENRKTYSTLIIPRLKARQALRFIDTYYGTWSSGMLTFCDYDRSYFMKFGSECTVYTKDENRETCIIIPDNTHQYVNESCTLIKDPTVKSATDYVIAENQTASIRNESISNQYVNSNDVTVVNPISGDIDESYSDTIVRSKNNSRLLENKTENKWLGDIYTSLSSASRRVIEVTLQDYDIDVIKPNKKFTVYFTNTKTGKKNKGSFLLGQAEHYFMKEGTEFILNSRIVLRSGE